MKKVVKALKKDNCIGYIEKMYDDYTIVQTIDMRTHTVIRSFTKQNLPRKLQK